jgi:hypothetical protein
MIRKWLHGGLCAIAIAGNAACGATDAFVYKQDEFDRDAKTFNKEPTDRDAVTICYNGVGMSDRRVEAMAQDECTKFGKSAVPAGEGFGACPLLTPIEAYFACVASNTR